MSEVLGLRVNNYEILSLIGEGGMGSVYLAKHPVIGRLAAIKVLRPELAQDPALIARFMNEARAANAIRHPNLIDIIDVGTLANGTTYLMMEYLEGESFGALLERQKKLPVEQAIELVCQAADALQATHDMGIVHRDLKPDNLFLVPEPNAPFGLHLKVLDFGIAKLAGGLRNSPKTSTGIIMGTPLYMSPEQCRGIHDAIDHRSDIYSLAVILFHAVCGRPPFVSEGIGEIMGMHMFGEVPRPGQLEPSISPELEQVILKGLARDPGSRHQTMAGLQTDLRAARPTPPYDGRLAREARKLASDGLPVTAKSTTLSSFARESSPPRQADIETLVVRRPPYRLLALLAAGVVAAGVVAAIALPGTSRRRSAKPAPAPSASIIQAQATTVRPVAPPETHTEVRISITTLPEGADVKNAQNDELLGVTPYSAAFARGAGAMTFVLAKPGYQSQTHTLSLLRDETFDLSLVKEPEKRERLKARKDKPPVDPNAMRKL